MNNQVLKEILNLIDVEPIEENLFRGQNHDTEHVFGGQVLAQALTAAYRTVVPEHELHSLHAYFLRPGTGHALSSTRWIVSATAAPSAPACRCDSKWSRHL